MNLLASSTLSNDSSPSLLIFGHLFRFIKNGDLPVLKCCLSFLNVTTGLYTKYSI